MNVGQRFIAKTMTGLGLAIFLVLSGASAAWAYPAGTAPIMTASASTVVPGGTLTLRGSHFSGTVTFVGHSASVDLGTTEASGPEGTFVKTVTITASEFPAGDHTIVATDAVGDSSTFGFSVGASAAGGGGREGSSGSESSSGGGGGLASTGVAVLSIGGVGVLLLIGGGIMLMAGQRRKATV